MTNYLIRQAATDDDFRQYFHLRWRLLRAPWDQPEGSEKDDLEAKCFHVIAITDDGDVIGVGRLQSNTPEQAQIRYMAVDERYERRGVGSDIILALERHAIESKHQVVILDARESAVGFYEKSGYSVTAESYLLFDDIQHFSMMKAIEQSDR